LKQQAVLFRTSSHSGPLEIELTRRNIPFVKFGGLKFLDAAHIKDMLALLRVAEKKLITDLWPLRAGYTGKISKYDLPSKYSEIEYTVVPGTAASPASNQIDAVTHDALDLTQGALGLSTIDG
jgi:hypothetical protein